MAALIRPSNCHADNYASLRKNNSEYERIILTSAVVICSKYSTGYLTLLLNRRNCCR